jgi:hypothetical protein
MAVVKGIGMGSQRTLLGLRAYARHRGTLGLVGQTLGAVQKAIESGRISTIEGKIDPAVADIQWAQHTDPDQQRRASAQLPTAGLPMQRQPAAGIKVLEFPSAGIDARRRRDLAEAELAELELKERLGVLCNKEDMLRGAKRLASALVQLLAPIADRISAEFGVDDEHRSKIRQRLKEELDGCRSELSRAGLMGDQ